MQTFFQLLLSVAEKLQTPSARSGRPTTSGSSRRDALHRVSRRFLRPLTVLMAPLVLALVGINFRGAAFALSHFGRETGRELPLGVLVFERVLTPFTPGLAVAATAAGRITIAGGEPLTGTGAWAKPFTLVAFLTVLPIGATVIIPSLFYPYWTFRGEPAPEIPPAGSETD